MRTKLRWASGTLLAASLACTRQPAPESSEPAGCAPVKMPGGSAPTYRCTLRSGEPPVMVRLVFDSAARTVEHIELRREGDTLAFQVLAESQEETAPDGVFPFEARDLDADGWLDFMLLSMWGATGNTYHQVWRWDPRASRFAHDSVLSITSSLVPVPGRPCVRGHAKGGHAGLIYGEEELCLERGRWVTVRTETQDWNESLGAYVRERKARRGNELVVVGVDTVRR